MVNRRLVNQLALKELTAPKKKRITVLTLYDLLLPDCQSSLNRPPEQEAIREKFTPSKKTVKGRQRDFLKNFFGCPGEQRSAFPQPQIQVPLLNS